MSENENLENEIENVENELEKLEITEPPKRNSRGRPPTSQNSRYFLYNSKHKNELREIVKTELRNFQKEKEK